uniref:Homeobox domain-containing protein n=1 Tax=Caenorhabditis tropicalis TaxID=1561998 RepID=A0A1I7T1S8_9PELO
MSNNPNLNNPFDFPELPKISYSEPSGNFLGPQPFLQQFDAPRNVVPQLSRRWSCGDSQHGLEEMPASYYHNLGFALHNHIQMSNQRYLSDFNCPSTVSPLPSAHETGQLPPLSTYDHIGNHDPNMFSPHAYGGSIINPGALSSGSSQSCGGKRRFRTNFTEQQSMFLEASFTDSHYPDHKAKKHMADYLNIPEDRITVWFQNRRAKWRRKEHRQRDKTKNELFSSAPTSFDYSCFPGPGPEENMDVKHAIPYGIPIQQFQMTHEQFQANLEASSSNYIQNQEHR